MNATAAANSAMPATIIIIPRPVFIPGSFAQAQTIRNRAPHRYIKRQGIKEHPMLKALPIALLVLMTLTGFAASASAEQIYIYDRPNFLGEDYEATLDVPDLAGTPIAGKSASLRAREGVWL